MENLVTAFDNNYLILAAIYFTSIALKAHILVTKSLKFPRTHMAWFFLFIALISSMVNDLTWIIFLLFKHFNLTMHVVKIFAYIAWIFYFSFYTSLILLIESLFEKKYKPKIHHGILILATGLAIVPFPFFIAHYVMTLTRHALEGPYLSTGYTFFLIIFIPTILYSIIRVKTVVLPAILKKQLRYLLSFFVAPLILSDLLQYYFSSFSAPVIVQPIPASLSTMLATIVVYFCFNRIFGLRFLNFKEHVSAAGTFDFIYDFKHVLAQLGNAMNEPEVTHITKSFFHKALHIPYSKTNLIIRNLNNSQPNDEKNTSLLESNVENFISICKDQPETAAFLQETKIFIYHEIAFSAFYEETQARKSALLFLEKINADVFLPIYDKQIIVAYIIVERNARGEHLFTNIERDEMVVFASYLGNIVYLLQNKNLDAIIFKEHAIKAELYNKHQEINQYKESIQSFLRSAKERKIGLLFYKNRKFIFGNQAAQEFVTINLNTQEGHPLTKAFKAIARQVETYKSPQSCLTKNAEGNRVVIAGLPNLEQNNVIFTIYYPEVSDVLKEQINNLKDPSEWDYVLYLETTTSGQLVNQLIPGNGPTLLQFKINLLKAALNKKATLLEIAEEDLADTADILHHISLRQQLHTIKLLSHNKNLDIAIKIFGINPIFDNQNSKPLLEQLNGNGTLFIQNIHFLDLETQQHLSDFIKYGFFRLIKSDQRIYSDVRIICSTNQNLHTLVQEGKFLDSLYNELKSTVLSMPSLLTLSDSEFIDLTNEYVEQATHTQTLKNFFELTEKEKVKLTHHRPVSLHDLKERVRSILIQKSKKQDIYDETYFNPAYNIADPELAEAAKLGKHALRDQKIMSMLWHKFKNQNKIATFLGVNRSSVNRRCKDFNLQ